MPVGRRPTQDQRKTDEFSTTFDSRPVHNKKVRKLEDAQKQKLLLGPPSYNDRLCETLDRMTSLQAVMKENIRQAQEDQNKIKEKLTSFQIPLTLDPYITRKYGNWKKMPKNKNYFWDRSRIMTDSVRRWTKRRV